MSNGCQGWSLVKFGDVVRQVKDRVDVAESGLTRDIAGEHMDSDDLKLRRWGEVNGDYLGPAFHMRFEPGQVLYGSRRTYLRKVAVADFEGICANTTFVLESKDPNVLLPELLPFVMQTEAFHEHSIKQSKGSVNPYVNFSDLARYEFALPRLDEQRRFLTTLTANATMENELLNAYGSLQKLRQSIESHTFGAFATGVHVSLKSLTNDGVLSFQTGPFGTVLKAASYTTQGHPVINPSDMSDGRVVLDKCKYVSASEWKRLWAYQVRTDDMFIGRKGDMRNLVFVTPEYDRFLLGSDCIRFRVHDSKLVAKYLFYFLRAGITQEWLQRQAYGTVMPGINEKLLAKLVMPVPAQTEQDRVVEELHSVDMAGNAIKQRLNRVRDQKRILLAQLNTDLPLEAARKAYPGK